MNACDRWSRLTRARGTTQVVCPLAQVDQIFATADADGGGTIDRDEALQLWIALGDARATVDPDSRIRKLLNISSSDPGANDPEVVATWVVTKEQFRSWCRNNTPSATLSLGIFAVQTVAMLFRDNGLFGWANLLNMDPETASGSCLAPMRMLGLTSKMYISVLTPGGAFVTAVVGYFALKRLTGLNMRMRPHHLKRAMVQVRKTRIAALL